MPFAFRTDGYWVVNDHNPTTEVYNTGSVDGYVANSTAAFSTWLSSDGAVGGMSGNNIGGFGLGVLGTAAGAAGVVRLTVFDTSRLQSGQRGKVAKVLGTTEANGFWQFNVIDATHLDLVGTTYANAYVSGGIMITAEIVNTEAELWSGLNDVSRSGWGAAIQNITSTGTVTFISSPIGGVVNFTATDPTHTILVLPNMRSPRSPPIGTPFRIGQTEASVAALGFAEAPFMLIYAQDGAAILACCAIGDQVELILTANDTKNGTFLINSISRNQGVSTARNIVGVRNAGFSTGLNWSCSLLLFVGARKQSAAFSMLGVADGSADISIAGPVASGRDQVAAFVAGDTVHFYQLQSSIGIAKIGIVSKSPPTTGGPTMPTGYDRWVYICSAILIAGPLVPRIGVSGNYVYYQRASTEAVVVAAGAATVETSIAATLNTLVPAVPVAKYRIFLNLTTTNANILTLYNVATQAYCAINVGAGAFLSCEITMPSTGYLAYSWLAATGSAKITVLGYNVGNGDA